LKENYGQSGLLLPEKEIEGETSWRSPSNIALVKYWGKYGRQLPKNPSISMTLSHAFTETHLYYKKSSNKPQRSFLFDGNENQAFAKRVWTFVDTLNQFFPFLQQLDLTIKTNNSFPHSAGIASSASAMSALALCLVDMEKQLFQLDFSDEDFYKKASYIARLGSGSASRSVYPKFAVWGKAEGINEQANNELAIPVYQSVNPWFFGLKDAIIIVDSAQKKVSSSLGHSLMNNHPYASDRLKQANENMLLLSKALRDGDQQGFIEIVESEALSLHALMMTSKPWFMLMKPESMLIIEKIREYRENSGIFISFTMDAGPNVHLLYHRDDEREVKLFIEKELKQLCSADRILFDEMGNGPIKLK